jgi:hypothetical protein
VTARGRSRRPSFAAEPRSAPTACECEPVALDALRRDDALLDDLADGAPAPDGDALATLLAAWRDVIDEGL